MKKIDKLKRQRYVLSMKIINLEDKAKRTSLTLNEEKELAILKQKEVEISERIKNL